ncbi:uncharacterized protein LOC114241628 [Bombyx mandarina]|uniref:Uncharacterized protein LOC114241628 n=1 Tax=Bombyx mandarina TaxID=7092 RepID=A0A6J2JG69_BOMMA|nr:uncharacterized protein LOC114241628 [Bombyx mandarina]
MKNVAKSRLLLLFVLFGELTALMPEENFSAANINNSNVPDTDATQRNCTTGNGTPGSCVLRRYCDYGTVFIDFTLYAPRKYVRQCGDKEACCPFTAQLPVLQANTSEDDASFEFDEND